MDKYRMKESDSNIETDDKFVENTQIIHVNSLNNMLICYLLRVL